MDWKNGNEDFFKRESEMFDRAADYYDQYRPGYPEEIIRTLIREADINENSELLEIGAGSGKATRYLADIGCGVCGVDPGPALVARGNSQFEGYPKIHFECARFEELQENPGHYDAICSFQAFHWVPQPVGYIKCARQLKQTGRLALVWNMPVTYDNDLDRELLEISPKFGGLADFMSEEKCEERIASNIKSIEDSGLFGEVSVFRHLWRQDYTADDYFGLCLTGNGFIQKSDDEKRAAHTALRQLTDKHGGIITRPYLCALYLAAKK
jgi:SAM-dependent methyltransferase